MKQTCANASAKVCVTTSSSCLAKTLPAFDSCPNSHGLSHLGVAYVYKRVYCDPFDRSISRMKVSLMRVASACERSKHAITNNHFVSTCVQNDSDEPFEQSCVWMQGKSSSGTGLSDTRKIIYCVCLPWVLNLQFFATHSAYTSAFSAWPSSFRSSCPYH